MPDDLLGFRGPLADLLSGFVREKRAWGHAYPPTMLSCIRQLDRHFSEAGEHPPCPDESQGSRFLAPRPGEALSTTKQRTHLWRQFASFCRRQGIDAWIPDAHSLPLCPLRHTFAVHRLENWFLANEDVEAKLPILSAYMGHTNLRDTYYYLRITQSFFPEITRRLQREVGDIIPCLPESSFGGDPFVLSPSASNGAGAPGAMATHSGH